MSFGPPFFRPGPGDEHPSGLRDVIQAAIRDFWGVERPYDSLLDAVDDRVSAWLSVVSEGEIEAAARAIDAVVGPAKMVNRELWLQAANAGLAASRGVLLPKETTGSSYSAGPPSMKEHP